MHNSDSIGVSASVTDSEVGQLMEAIFLRYSYDFRDYSGPSQRRRVAYALQKLGYSSIAALQDKLLLDADMFSRMLQFLTIPVTSMFRDPAFYLALREYVIPWLRTYASLKIWIAGCSSGEEVYSMAILLREEGLLDRAIIYATDINQQSLEKARKGVYALDGISAGTANYQQAGGLGAFSDYYMASYNAALFDRSLLRLHLRYREVLRHHRVEPGGHYADAEHGLLMGVRW